MRPKINPYRKALARRPFRTLVLALLFAAAAYTFTAHMAEYLLVSGELERLRAYYKPVGYLEKDDWDVRKAQALIAESPYLEFEDVRRTCSGLLEGMQNTDFDGVSKFTGNYSEVVFTGTYQGAEYTENPKGQGGYYRLEFRVKSLLGGYGDYMSENRTVFVMHLPGLDPENTNNLDTLSYYPAEQDAPFLEELGELREGETYLLRAWYTELYGVNSLKGAQSGYIGSHFVLETLPQEERYFSLVQEDFAVSDSLQEYLAYLDETSRVMSVVGTKDMSRMPDCIESAKEMYLTEGRWLTREDDTEGRRVCVVNEFFARTRGLGLGDTVTLCLKNEDNPLYYQTWEVWEDAKKTGRDSETAEFEIVGIYDNLNYKGSFLTLYSITMYVPDSCIPAGYVPWDSYLDSMSYSFVLKNPEDKQKFLAENRDKLEELGCTVLFVENNADSFAETSSALLDSTRMSAGLSGAVFCGILLLGCMLFTVQHRREYALMRALGVPAGRAGGCFLCALGGIGVLGFVPGALAGWLLTLKNAKELLEPVEFLTDEPQTAALPAFWLPLFFAGMLAVLFLPGICAALSLSRRPILSLLAGHAAGGAAVRRKREPMPPVVRRTVPSKKVRVRTEKKSMEETPVLSDQPQKRLAVRRNYIRRHQSRAVGGTVSVLLFSVAAVLTLVWMQDAGQRQKQEIDRIYATTVVTGELVPANSGSYSGMYGGAVISRDIVDVLQATGLVQEVYVEAAMKITSLSERSTEENGSRIKSTIKDVTVLAVYDWEGFLEETGADVSFLFGARMDGEHFVKGNQGEDARAFGIILPESVMASEWDIGTLLSIESEKKVETGKYRIVGTYTGSLGNGLQKNTVLVSGEAMEYIKSVYGQDDMLLTARVTFDSAKNRELLEQAESLEQIAAEDKKSLLPLRLVIWDQELREVLEPMERTLALFQVLFPAAAAVFAVTGFGLQLLLILQRSREAAIMRALGTSVSEVRLLIVSEQLINCIAGFLAGLLLAGILGWQMTAGTLIGLLAYLAGSAAGMAAGGINVTNRRPLELLQVKE